MDHAVCNIFESGNYSTVTSEKHFYSVLEEISNGTYKDNIEKLRANLGVKDVYAKIKKMLPSFTPCGTFTGNRLITNINQYNGIVPIDFDGINNSDKANYLKLLLSRDMYICAAFISPSFGVKAFMQTNCFDPKYHRYAFEVCRDYIESKYSSFLEFKVDKSGKDITRLCFLSYDPTIHINTAYETVEVDWEEMKQLEEFRIVENRKVSEFTETNVVKIIEFCIKGVNASSVGRYGKGNRNNWIYSLARSCNTFGVDENAALNYIAGRYTSLGYEETKQCVHSAYSKNRQEFATKTLGGKKTNQSNLF